MSRQRADIALVERGLFASRQQAKAAILAGQVRIDGVVVDKAGQGVAPDAQFEVETGPRYVSRGGHKLDGALIAFGIDVSGVDALDVGASTGGFTDRLLQGGARSVTAVDVGYGQLAWQLRTDDRVRVFERTNIRHADPEELGAPFELIVIDVSFIGLGKVLPSVVPMLAEGGDFVALVKPQFEAGRGRVGKKGVVRDAAVHADVLRAVLEELTEAGLVTRGVTWSPIKGPEGNIEFWVWASRSGVRSDMDIERLVREAHQTLGD